MSAPRRSRRWRRAAFVVSSFGKTFHVTGWKVGTVAAPAPLTAEFRKVHQFNVFTVNTPMQHALARYLADPAPYLRAAGLLPAQARPVPRRAGRARRLRLLPCEGSYFQTVDYSAVSDLGEAAFCEWLTREVGVAAIPLSAFYADGTRAGPGAAVLRQAGRDAARGAGAAGRGCSDGQRSGRRRVAVRRAAPVSAGPAGR